MNLGLQPYPQKVVRPPKPTITIFSGGSWSPRGKTPWFFAGVLPLPLLPRVLPSLLNGSGRIDLAFRSETEKAPLRAS